MSSITPSADHPQEPRRDLGESLARWVGKPIAALSFWTAIALPAIYLPLIIAGISDTETLLTFLSLFALHVVVLVCGHRYRAPK